MEKFNSNKYKQKFNKENYLSVSIYLKKEKVQEFRKICKAKGITQASIIEKAIDEFIKVSQ